MWCNALINGKAVSLVNAPEGRVPPWLHAVDRVERLAGASHPLQLRSRCQSLPKAWFSSPRSKKGLD